jgi:hypothetical protein
MNEWQHGNPTLRGGYVVTVKSATSFSTIRWVLCLSWNGEEWLDSDGVAIAREGIEAISWIPLPDPEPA